MALGMAMAPTQTSMSLSSCSTSSELVASSGRFVLGKKLGAGAFGEVFVGKDLEKCRYVAIKLESSKSNHRFLEVEAQACRRLAHSGYVPDVHWYESWQGGSMMVSDLQGPSLEALLTLNRRPFGLKTVLTLADQMLDALRQVHEAGLLHRDLKPDNFLIGLGDEMTTVKLIDFGLAGSWRDPSTRKHIAMKRTRGPVGTLRYMSINSHGSWQQSRRDDLESLGYVLIFLLKGRLPWQSIQTTDKAERHQKVMHMKSQIPIGVLCRDLPEEFGIVLQRAKNMSFEQVPAYGYLQEVLLALFLRRGYHHDGFLDWCRPGSPFKEQLQRPEVEPEPVSSKRPIPMPCKLRARSNATKVLIPTESTTTAATSLAKEAGDSTPKLRSSTSDTHRFSV